MTRPSSPSQPPVEPTSAEEWQRELNGFLDTFSRVESEIARVIVGMREVVRLTIVSVFAGGHVLLEGVPGLGKTLLVKSIARALGLNFRRIQFTPDLMPSDVTGTQVLTEDDDGKRRFVFKPGPVFTNVLLADEINRATPKTQASLLESMEERQVSVLGETYRLPAPFFVLATQNPVELEGTYPLPEAQLDRFLLKLLVAPPSGSELKEILSRTTGVEIPQSQAFLAPEEMVARIERMKLLVRHVKVAPMMYEVIARMMEAVTPQSSFATEKAKQYLRFGPGPRGAQAIMMAAKVHALLDSRINLSVDDIRQVLMPALRHRLILNFQAEADGVTSDGIIEEVRNAR
jgi:MoxR-like ATPase